MLQIHTYYLIATAATLTGHTTSIFLLSTLVSAVQFIPRHPPPPPHCPPFTADQDILSSHSRFCAHVRNLFYIVPVCSEAKLPMSMKAILALVCLHRLFCSFEDHNSTGVLILVPAASHSAANWSSGS